MRKTKRPAQENKTSRWFTILLTVGIFPIHLIYRLLVRIPREQSILIGAFRASTYLMLMCLHGDYDWLEKAQAFSDAEGGVVGSIIITAAMGLVVFSFLQFVLGLLLACGAYEGKVIRSGKRGVVDYRYPTIEKVLSYRDSKMSGMNNEGQIKEMAETGFLGAGGGLAGGPQTDNAMKYLNSKLGNYSYQGGLDYIKGLYGKK